MNIETMNNPKAHISSHLAAYLHYVSEEGIDLVRFVEHGARLLAREDAGSVAQNLAELREKIPVVRRQHPRLAQQLEFLETFFASDSDHLPDAVRKEVAFALLYAAKGMDLIPDDMPEVGYLDDAAVTELVLSRHARFFEQHCAAHDIEWAALKPGNSD